MRPAPELIAVALAATLVAGAAAAAESNKVAPPSDSIFDMGGVSDKKDPITISSDTLDYDYKNNIVVYRGDVQAAQGQVKIRSDTLRVTFDNAKDSKDPKDAKDPKDPKDAKDPKDPKDPKDAKDPKDPPAAAAATPSPVPDPGSKGQQRVHEVTALGNVRIDQGTKWATGGKAVFDQSQRTLVLTQTPVLHDGPNEVAGDKVIVFLDENRSVVEGGRKRVKAVLYPGKDGGLVPATPGAAPPEAHAPVADKTAAAATAPEPTAQP